MLQGSGLTTRTVFFATLIFLSEPSAFHTTHEARQHGVSWVAGPEPVTERDFEPLIRNHVNWIVQIPFGWQGSTNSPSIKLVTSGVHWGETDIGIETTTRMAKQAGIKTLLKPHIWLQRSEQGKWRGEIEMDSERDWGFWFANYRKLILHYAWLAEKNGIEALSVGTELYATAVKREQDWRDLIADVRKVYHGKLTYSANWYREFEEVQFWDALDFIGVQAYFPLTRNENPDLSELVNGWAPHVEALARLSRKYHRPVVFTEIGYRSTTDAAIKPWEWPRRSSQAANKSDLQTQANCYEAFFRTFWNKEWCAGAYFWKWFPKLSHARSYRGRDFTPQHKPAEVVMAKWYHRPVN
ncbi:MAG: glycoside hydrolase TIM-barrel-like domain-containing protein [bacterium]